MRFCSTSDRFLFGRYLETLDLSLYKLAINLAISVLELMCKFEFLGAGSWKFMEG